MFKTIPGMDLKAKSICEMKKSIKVLLISIWQITATLILTFIWGNNPDLFAFLTSSESFANWLADLYKVKNAEELGDLELLYIFIVAFIFVLLVTTILVTISKKSSRG